MRETLTPEQLAGYIDHTLLRPNATAVDIKRLCADAKQYSLNGVCVNSSRVELAVALLEGTDVKVSSVVGFPFGTMDADVKRYETEVAVDLGAHEIDVVLNVGFFRDHQDKRALRELRDIVEAADERPVKVILQVPLLSQDEVGRACEMIRQSGALFVVTAPGLREGDDPAKQVALLRSEIGDDFPIKANGEIGDADALLELVDAGATRIGTPSGAEIIAAGAGDE